MRALHDTARPAVSCRARRFSQPVSTSVSDARRSASVCWWATMSAQPIVAIDRYTSIDSAPEVRKNWPPRKLGGTPSLATMMATRTACCTMLSTSSTISGR
jgi:hypothetical protein